VIALLKQARNDTANQDASEALRSLNRDQLLNVLAELLIDPDLEIRDNAVHALMKIDPYHGVDLIIPLLNDPLDSWRWYVCYALAYHGDERSIIPLTQVLLHDPDSDTRYMAASALENIGDERALPALRHAQQHDQGTDYEGRRIDTIAGEAIQAILNRSQQAPDQ
jgi:HEAT repeat protein